MRSTSRGCSQPCRCPNSPKSRADLETLATKGRTATTRQIGYVALLAADGGIDKAWEAGHEVGRRAARLRRRRADGPRPGAARRAVPEGRRNCSAGCRRTWRRPSATASRAVGRYVRIELPGKQRTLTLAEVEVFSDGVNVARKGKATQSSTAHGGVAARGIDGNTSGNYDDGGQTHTQEGTDEPVVGGRSRPRGADREDRRVEPHRRQPRHRLKNFTVRVLDADRKDVFESEKNPTPKEKAEFAVGAVSPERVVRKAAMLALTSVRGQEADAFKAIAKFLADRRRPRGRGAGAAPHPAARLAEGRREAAARRGDEVHPLAAGRGADHARGARHDATRRRRSRGCCRRPRRKAARKELAEIGVRVIRVGTLFDQMSFDKERLVVQAGKPVEFVFENTDIMPHNFVIVTPGNLEKIGNAAEAFATAARRGRSGSTSRTCRPASSC